MYNFCTYFDHNYLPRGIALYRSLAAHCPNFKLWALCLTRECYEVLSAQNLPNVIVISLEQLEEGDDELLKAKANRTVVEYYYTLTPCLPLFILKNYTEVDLITHLDSDLFFFSDPGPIYEEIADSSIGIIEHRFPEEFKHLNRNGRYNVSWISYRRDKTGLDCLRWYRDKCIEWCYQRAESNRFADQKYLESFEELFGNVCVIQHKGANLASFNVQQYKIGARGRRVEVDGQCLVFFHFHGFSRLATWLYDTGFSGHRAILTSTIREMIYKPYIRELKVTEGLNSLGDGKGLGDMRYYSDTTYVSLRGMLPNGLFDVLKSLRSIARVIFTNTGIVCAR